MEYFTVKEVAELKGCSVRYIKRIAHEGKLEAVKEISAANKLRTVQDIRLRPAGRVKIPVLQKY